MSYLGTSLDFRSHAASLSAFHSLVAPLSYIDDNNNHNENNYVQPNEEEEQRQQQQHAGDDDERGAGSVSSASASSSSSSALVTAVSIRVPSVITELSDEDCDDDEQQQEHKSATDTDSDNDDDRLPAVNPGAARRVQSMPQLPSELANSPITNAAASSMPTHAVSAPISIPTSSPYSNSSYRTRANAMGGAAMAVGVGIGVPARAHAQVQRAAVDATAGPAAPFAFVHRRDRGIPYASRPSNYHPASFIDSKQRFVDDDAADLRANYDADADSDDEKSNTNSNMAASDMKHTNAETFGFDGLFICDEDLDCHVNTTNKTKINANAHAHAHAAAININMTRARAVCVTAVPHQPAVPMQQTNMQTQTRMMLIPY